MEIALPTKIRNGKITLPAKLRQNWKTAEVFISFDQDTIVVKKFQEPLSQLSQLASRISSKPMSQKEINKEIQAFRKNK